MSIETGDTAKFYRRTGEVRRPNPGEWYEDWRGCPHPQGRGGPPETKVPILEPIREDEPFALVTKTAHRTNVRLAARCREIGALWATDEEVMRGYRGPVTQMSVWAREALRRGLIQRTIFGGFAFELTKKGMEADETMRTPKAMPLTEPLTVEVNHPLKDIAVSLASIDKSLRILAGRDDG